MKAPESLETLVEYGIIQEVIRPLMSGKEAQVFVVEASGKECVAKVYKEAHQRTFRHRSDYTEGRRTRNSRDQRAMNKRSQHGRKKDEDAWRSMEVDMIYRLRDAGVRVPEPFNFVEGVLVMELVTDGEGRAAPRLGDLTFSAEKAKGIYAALLQEVVRMLCAGVIHGDLSEFNVLMGADGPVVIDFPQAVDPTLNPNSKKLFLRDVENLHRFLARWAPDETIRPYGEEMWALFEKNRLKPDTQLAGRYAAPAGKADTQEVMALIEDAHREQRARRGEDREEEEEAFDGPARSPVTAPATFRKVVDFTENAPARSGSTKAGQRRRASSRTRPGADGAVRRGSSGRAQPPSGPASEAQAETRRASPPVTEKVDETGKPRPSRRRRRRRSSRDEKGDRETLSSEASSSQSPASSSPSAKARSPEPPSGPSGPKGRATRRRRAGAKRSSEKEGSRPSPAESQTAPSEPKPASRRRRRRPRRDRASE